MSELIDISLSLPTVVFTVAALTSVGYWLVSAALGFADGLGPDADFDLDADLEPGFDLDTGSSGFGLSSLIGILGLHLVPVSVSITVLSLVSWLTSVAAVVMLGGAEARVGAPAVVVVLAAALVVGMVVVGRLARVVAPVFATRRAEQHRDLVGRLCTVQTGRVDAVFGQGMIRSPAGDEHVVQIRCPGTNRLGAGDRALVVDVDDGVFVVSPDVDGLT